MPDKSKTRRYTLDMNEEQLRFLKLFALEKGLFASTVIRSLIYLLETDDDLQYAVIDEIYPVDRDPFSFLINISRKDRNVKRFTLDLHVEQTNYLGFININQGIDGSVLLRTMIYLLEIDALMGSASLQEKVLKLVEQGNSHEE